MYAGLRRFLVLCVLAPLFTLGGFAIARYLKSPHLSPGDRIETRTCRECGGRGRDESLARENPGLSDRCPACGGDGKVEVLLPGSQHPTRIRGVVAESARANPYDTYQTFKPKPSGEGPISFASPPGVIAGVKVTARDRDGQTFEAESGESGLFTLELAPDRYVLTAAREGFATLQQEIEVPVLTEPIWLEEANIIREPTTDAEARSLYGLDCLVALAKPGAEGGRAVLTAGLP